MPSRAVRGDGVEVAEEGRGAERLDGAGLVGRPGQGDDLLALTAKRLDQVAADEAGAACHEHAHSGRS